MKGTIYGICLLVSASAFADSKKPAKAPGKDDMQKMMMEMEKAATPGPEHKWLTDAAGTWNAASKMWMEPGKPPMESTGTEEVKPVLGGRFVEVHITSNMMGKPFEGMGVEGYDNTTKKFVMTWMDSMGTSIIRAEGTGDAKQRTFTGEETMPNGMKRPFRWVYKMESKDKRVMEMYGPGMDGKEMKQMEVVYTRK